MNSSVPKIGFDRFVPLEWAAGALKVRAGITELDDLDALLAPAKLGVEAREKTFTKLNALWLHPRAELLDFSSRAVELFKAHPDIPVAALSWGMAIASYPFFGKIAEIVGRLTALHGDCTSAEIHRRMSEVYGERAVTKRATQAVIQTQASWGALERVEKGSRIIRLTQTPIASDVLAAWLIEAAVRCMGKPLSVPSLQSLAVLFPFALVQPLSYVISAYPNLEIRANGPSNQVVDLSGSYGL